jgi:hypothetical protein
MLKIKEKAATKAYIMFPNDLAKGSQVVALP